MESMPTPLTLHCELDARCLGPHAPYTEQTMYWWLPDLGPTASLLLQRLAQIALLPEGDRWCLLSDMQIMLGVSLGGRNSKLMNALARLERYADCVLHGNGTEIHVSIPNGLPIIRLDRRERWPEGWNDIYENEFLTKAAW